jgi:hypothetical protein
MVKYSCRKQKSYIDIQHLIIKILKKIKVSMIDVIMHLICKAKILGR